MGQYGIDIVNDYDPKVAIKEYVKEFYNVSRYTADYIADVIVNNCYNILNMIEESLKEAKTSNLSWKVTYGKGRPGGSEEILQARDYEEAKQLAAKHANGWGFGIERIDKEVAGE